MKAHTVVRILLVLALAAAASAAWAQAAGPEPSVVAVVNGEEITREALVSHILNLTNTGRMILDQMIGEALLQQEARKLNVTVPDQEVEERIAVIKDRLGRSEERFKQYLVEQNVTEAGLVHKVRIKLLAEKVLADRIQVAENEVESTYERSKTLYDRPETAVLRWIRVKTEAEAQAVGARLAKGDAFEDVAKEVSTDMLTRPGGGLVGEVRQQDLPEELQEPVFSTEVGKWTQPIKTKEGDYAIVMVVRKTAAAKHDPEFVRAQIRMDLRERNLRQAWLELMAKLRQQGTVDNRLAPAEK